MNVLIILEQKLYASLAKKLEVNPQINVEVTNVDFDLTKSIIESQVVIFFGELSEYSQFYERYQNNLKSKLIIKTCNTSASSLNLQVDMHINSGVGICAIPDIEPAIRSVIIETIHTIFDTSLKIICTTTSEFENMVKTISRFEQDLLSLCISTEDTFGIAVALHILKNFNPER